jgi:hypothetical protein
MDLPAKHVPPLKAFAGNVGALQPPAQWAEDYCKVQGVDYDKLRQFLDGGKPPTESEEDKAVAEFADQFIGDYVDKLEQFVEYYNMQYPSHEGDDTVVLSLRDDLLTAERACVRTSPNLLYYSGRMTQSDMVTENGERVVRGWQARPCELALDRCLRVVDGGGLPQPGASEPPRANEPPQADVGAGVTWLREARAFQPDAGVDAAGGGSAEDGSASKQAPARTIYQDVSLAPGAHVLSWYDQARDPDHGNLVYAGVQPKPSTMEVGVYSADWQAVATQLVEPYRAPSDPAPVPCADGGTCDGRDPWSLRRALRFTVQTAGSYHVAFRVSSVSESPGSVAVSNTQLERLTAPSADPAPYHGTTSSREILSNECKSRSPEEVQAAFEYRCDSPDGCYYQLSTPIMLNTTPRAPGCGVRSLLPKTGVRAKLAQGNYNYRHITVAVNLVGTGLRDCTLAGTPSCYGSGFSEYTLSHDAFNAGILGWDGNVRDFNFGLASINHAKALSAERFITMPFGAADVGLLAQPGIEKQELRGRPLEGSYRLRIWENPALVWGRLEDVQIIFKYRYWSPILPQANLH